MMKTNLILILLLVISCTHLVKNTDKEYFKEVDLKNNSHLQILFSHNINGETHPCGCRQFPLGGFSQINGLINSQRKLGPTIYVDTGDTFFESTIVPPFLEQSSKYKAEKIVEALNLLELKIMVLGDQDYAMGETVLLELSKKAKFKFLLSNASSKNKIKHEKLISINIADKKFFFIGVLDPDLLRPELRYLFEPMQLHIKQQLEIIAKDSTPIENRTIILLSHNGLETDEKLAAQFPVLDWIIGAHSQSYLRFSKDVKDTKIVQVLSRNHFLGKIALSLNKNAKSDYEILESRDETKDLVSPNIFISWLNDFKSQFDKILLQEQDMLSEQVVPTTEQVKIPTYISCSDCHKKQVDFWQSTEHSLAYSTLVENKAHNNPTCIKCHSVGMNMPGGFNSSKNIIISEHKNLNLEAYWKDLVDKKMFKHPVRELSPTTRKTIAKKWLKHDIDLKIQSNYANVQCLNCHNQNIDHPFGENISLKTEDYQLKCLTCHSQDQSPEWYNKDAKGLASSLNKTYFSKKFKQVSCPKIEKE